jgi:hypothetical protein
MGTQDIYFGRPILPEELQQMHYGDRKKAVLQAINALGPSNDLEQPLPGNAAFEKKVQAWQKQSGVSHEHAVLREVFAEVANPTEEVIRLLAAKTANELDQGPSGPWMAELGRRLIGS